MGLFLAASAFKDVSAQQLADAIVDVASEHDIEAEVLPCGPADEGTQAAVFAPSGDWTVVLWPSQFTLYDVDACQRSPRLSAPSPLRRGARRLRR